jgi:hypothetical protein
MKYISQNPSRFSVRVFRTPAPSTFAYPTATKVDLGYRSVQQSEQQRYVPRYVFSPSLLSDPLKIWNPHVDSNRNISHDTRLRSNNHYAIYPGALNDTYIYEQSACSEYDALSAATFSPAMSTDSTLTLRSPATPESFLEERARRPATPAAPSSYAVHGSVAPHPSAMSRTTTSIRHAYEPLVNTPSDRQSRVTSVQGHSTTSIRHPNPSASLNELAKVSPTTASYDGQPPFHIPEYATSTISELEVDQRDKIAKINAEYNAIASSTSSSYYSNNNAAVAIESTVRQMSTSPPNQPLPDTFTRAVSSQPLHLNLHFPTKPDEFNSTFNLNATPSIFRTKEGSPPLVERVPSGVEFPSTNTQSSQFLPPQAQDSWNRDGVYHSDSTHVPPHRPPTTNHPFDNGSVSHSTQTMYATSQETTGLNEYRPLPVPPPEAPRQRSTIERRSSVVGPRPDANVLKGASDISLRSQTTKEYSYDRRRDVSNSPPRGGSTLQPSSRELLNRAAMASDMRRDTRTPAPRDYPPAPLTRHDSYVADPQQPPVETRSQIPHPADTHMQPAAFVGPTETERSNDRIRTRSTSFSNSTRPNLPPVNNLSQPLASPQQYQSSNNVMPDPRRVFEQDKHVRTSPPSRMQETSVYHSDYVEPDHPNDVRGQAIYNSQPAPPTYNRDTHFSHRQNLPIGQPSSKKSGGGAPTINSRNAAQEVPSSRSRLSYLEVPAALSGVPTRGATPYVKSSIPVKAGGSSSSNSTDQEYVPPEQPTQRRYSDGDQNPPPRPVESSGRSSAPLIRSVRWTENLICPSPVPATQRRKGWFNRRG